MSYFWMLCSTFFYASMGAMVKAGSGVFSPLEMAGMRGVVAVLVLGAWAAATGRSMRTRYVKEHIARSLCGTISQALWFAAVGMIALSTATTINNTTPLWLALAAVFTAAAKKRKASRILTGSVLLGFTGVIIIFRPDLNVDPLGAATGLAGSLVTAGSYVQVSRLNRLREPVWRVVFYFSVLNCVFGLLGLATRSQWVMPAAGYWLLLTSIGITGLFAQLCFTRGLQDSNVVASSVLSFAVIPFGILLGAVFFGETIDLLSAAGFALIATAGATATVTARTERSGGQGREE